MPRIRPLFDENVAPVTESHLSGVTIESFEHDWKSAKPQSMIRIMPFFIIEGI
jgi:hypothetical protein